MIKKTDIRKHANKIIAGFIGLMLLAGTLFLKNKFKSTKPDISSADKQALNISAISNDTSKQVINQVVQTNQNTGDVNNEFISGDKIVNNKTVVVKQYKKKPEQRVVIKSDVVKILKTIPKDFTVELSYSFSNPECEKFGVAIADKLTELQYNFSISIYGQLMTNTYDDRFEIQLDEANKKAQIIVHVLREN